MGLNIVGAFNIAGARIERISQMHEKGFASAHRLKGGQTFWPALSGQITRSFQGSFQFGQRRLIPGQ